MESFETLRNVAFCALPLLGACSGDGLYGEPYESRSMTYAESLRAASAISDSREVLPIAEDVIDLAYLPILSDEDGNPAESQEIVKAQLRDLLDRLGQSYLDGHIVVSDTFLEHELEKQGLAPIEDPEHTCAHWGEWTVIPSDVIQNSTSLVNCLVHEEAHTTFNGGDYGHAPEVMATGERDASVFISFYDWCNFSGNLMQDLVDSLNIANGIGFGWDEYSAVDAIEGSTDFSINGGYITRFSSIYENGYEGIFDDMEDDPVFAYDALVDLKEFAPQNISDDFNFVMDNDISSVFRMIGVTGAETEDFVAQWPSFYEKPRQEIVASMSSTLENYYGGGLESGISEY